VVLFNKRKNKDAEELKRFRELHAEVKIALPPVVKLSLLEELQAEEKKLQRKLNHAQKAIKMLKSNDGFNTDIQTLADLGVKMMPWYKGV